jgi:SAM-dependent methyltransferase
MEPTLEYLACPQCKQAFKTDKGYLCRDCGIEFPEVNNVPVLINEANSVFRLDDFVQNRNTTYGAPLSGLNRLIVAMTPSISVNPGSARNYSNFFDGLRKMNARPRILVIGGAVLGKGMDLAQMGDDFELVETDVSFGGRTRLICDAHDLPFVSDSFDGVIAQAVLEHVIDPHRCVSELFRVLRPSGLVYAETPFMQQVHMGRYDFMRFSHLGHRRLFRDFDEIKSGPVGGPGMALAWAWAFFLRSLFRRGRLQQAAFTVGSLTGFWLKYFDHFLKDHPGSFDAASVYFFLGSKSETRLSDREIIGLYRGTF